MQLKDFDFRIWDTTSNAYLHNPSLTITHFKSAVYKNAYSMEVGEVIDENKDEREVLIGCLDNNRYKSVEIELWSGLCDKKGKKIYEGDILAHDNGYGIEYHSKVIFENGVFKIAVIEHPAVEIIEGLGTGFVAVVGNIHENADLLEEERGLIMRIECKYEDIYDSKGFPKY